MSGYTSKNLSHLGLVAGMCDRLQIAETIDALVPQDHSQQLVSDGVCVKALILNGLGFVERRLSLVSHFFSDKPIAHLLGDEVLLSSLNDDRLGRCLDGLYAYGLSELFSQISARACQSLGLGSSGTEDFIHLDSTSFHIDGQINRDSYEEGASVVHICPGYSRDHRPDLSQVMLNLVVEQSAGIPLRMEALSGNTSDKVSFRQLIKKHIASLQGDQKPRCWVADSALYSQESLREISAETYWITRVPESVGAAKEAVETLKKEQMNAFEAPELAGYRYQELGNTYAGIPQQWLVLFSQAAYEREIKTYQKKYQKESLRETKALLKLFRQVFHCEEDARKALQSQEARLRYTALSEPRIEVLEKQAKPGRNPQNAPKKVVGYQIQAHILSHLASYQGGSEKLGKFILASNDVQSRWTASQKVLAYKNQHKVEKGFRFLKDKQFAASTIFVQKPERIEAVLMIMTLSLMVYAALEKVLRAQLEAQELTLPNQIKKEVRNPTMKWVFALFTGVHCLYTDKQVILLNMNEIHQKVIQLLGDPIRKYYLIE